MRAAESLFARDGIENVSVRAILREAGQRNESAMHYHFGNKEGLVEALQDQRIKQVIDHRADVFEVATAAGRVPSVREICYLLIVSPFQLCGRDRGFRDFIAVFGQRLVVSGQTPYAHLAERGETRMQFVFSMLRDQVSLEPSLFEMRLDNMSRFALLAMARRAREGGSFRGKAAQLFVNDLADTMAGMLTATVSNSTKEVLAQ